MLSIAITIVNEPAEVWISAAIAASAAIASATLASLFAARATGREIRAQTRRLLEEQQETERRLRRDRYRDFLQVLAEQTEFARARTPSDEEFTLHFSAYQRAVQAVRLEESEAVRPHVTEVLRLNQEIGLATSDPVDEVPRIEQWRPHFLERETQIHDARGRLTEAMRRDVMPPWLVTKE